MAGNPTWPEAARGGARYNDRMADLQPTMITEAVREVLGGTSVFLVYAHGSRIRGDARPDSDLDLGYYALGDGRHACMDLASELGFSGALSDVLGCEVDLRCLAIAPLQVRGRVLEEGIRVYCSDEEARVDLERDLLGRYHDYKPKFEEWRRLRIESAARQGQ